MKKIFIFTAVVIGDEEKVKRQRTYLNALEEHGKGRVKVVYGTFRRPHKPYKINDSVSITIHAPQEKKSDVNLAGRMIQDAYTAQNEFDVACLVSKDIDLSYALEVREGKKLRNLLIAPLAEAKSGKKRGISDDLKQFVAPGDCIEVIPKSLVMKHLLPPKIGKYTVPDAEGWQAQKRR